MLVGMLLASVGYAQTSARDRTTGLGTVETIAGPLFCEGSAMRSEASRNVGALAVSRSGVLHFDSGRPSEGLLTKVDTSGIVSPVRTRPRTSPKSDLLPTGLPAGAQASGRLAPDARSGVMVATGRGVIDVESGLAITGEPLVEEPVPGPASVGDGGAAISARFRQVRAIASDTNGNLYVADALDPKIGQVRIRFVNRTTAPVVFYPGTSQQRAVMPGVIDTVTGGDAPLETGDGVLAGRAQIAGAGVSMALAGDRLYVGTSSGPGVDTPSSIRVVNIGGSELVAHGVKVAPGAVATVAGGRGSGLGGDGAAAREALLSTIGGLTVDERGNLYVADEGNHRIRRIDGAGVITTYAGASAPGTSGGGFNGNDRPASTARLDRPVDVDAGPNSRIYISDRGNGQVRFVDGAGTIRAAPGNGLNISWDCESSTANVDDKVVTGALDGVAADADGSIYLTVNALDQVKRLDGSGRLTTAVGVGATTKALACTEESGDAQAEACSQRAEGSRAALTFLDGPGALALRPGMTGGLYIFERGSARVRFANLSDRAVRVHGLTVLAGAVRTVAGNGSPGVAGDGGKAVDAELSSTPGSGALVADAAGNLFIGDTGRIRKVDVRGKITSVVPPALPPPPGPPRPPNAFPPCCGVITGLALAPGGGLYVADALAYVVWAANPGPARREVKGHLLHPGEAVPIAGSGNSGFEGDGGPATEARMVPRGIAVGPDGSIYVGQVVGAPQMLVDQNGQPIVDDEGNRRIVGNTRVSIDHSVRKVSPEGIASTVIGGSTSGFNGDGLTGRATNVWVPTAVAVDPCGNLVVVDRDNDRLRRLRLAASCDEAAPAAVDDTDAPSVLKPGLATFTIAMAAVGMAVWVRRRHR